MRAKARQTWAEAETLAASGQWSGAANRVYYAPYQALVAAFEARGLAPGDFSASAGAQEVRWPHWIVRGNAALAGLTRRDAAALKDAWFLRVQADYTEELLSREDVEPTLVRVRNILARLGAEA